MVLTNIGTLGLQTGLAPIPCPVHPSIVVCCGAVHKKPVVVNDQIVIREVMTVTYTMDHRQGDAAIIMPFLRVIKDLVENPEEFKPENHPCVPYYHEIEAAKKAKAN